MRTVALSSNTWYKEAQRHWNSIISDSMYEQNEDAVTEIVFSMYNAYNYIPTMFEILSDITEWNWEHTKSAIVIEVNNNPEMRCIKNMEDEGTRQNIIDGMIDDIVMNIDVQCLYEMAAKILSKSKNEIKIFDFEDPMDVLSDDCDIFANDAQNRIFRFPKCEAEESAESLKINPFAVIIRGPQPFLKPLMLEKGMKI